MRLLWVRPTLFSRAAHANNYPTDANPSLACIAKIADLPLFHFAFHIYHLSLSLELHEFVKAL